MRVRDERLRRVAEDASKALRAKAGVTEVSAHPRVGSLLIRYEPETVTGQELLAHLEALLDEGALRPSSSTRPGTRRFPLAKRIHRGMLAALAASMAGLLVRSERLHVSAGVAFLGGFAFHLFDHRTAFGFRPKKACRSAPRKPRRPTSGRGEGSASAHRRDRARGRRFVSDGTDR